MWWSCDGQHVWSMLHVHVYYHKVYLEKYIRYRIQVSYFCQVLYMYDVHIQVSLSQAATCMYTTLCYDITNFLRNKHELPVIYIHIHCHTNQRVTLLFLWSSRRHIVILWVVIGMVCFHNSMVTIHIDFTNSNKILLVRSFICFLISASLRFQPLEHIVMYFTWILYVHTWIMHVQDWYM